jgi:hypothetical protein
VYAFGGLRLRQNGTSDVVALAGRRRTRARARLI